MFDRDEYRPATWHDYVMSVLIAVMMFGVMILAFVLGGCSAVSPNVADVLKNAGKVTKDTIGPVYVLERPGFRCSAVSTGPNTAVTAAHCVGEDSPAEGITMRHLIGRPLPVAVTRIHEDRDVAELVLTNPSDPRVGKAGDRFPYWAVVAPEGPQLGDVVIVVGWGCTEGTAPFARPALVGRVGASSFTAAGKVCPGDSGGAVMNRDGALLGVGSASVELAVPGSDEITAGGIFATVAGVL